MAYHEIPEGSIYNDCIGWYMPRSSADPLRSMYSIYDVKCLVIECFGGRMTEKEWQDKEIYEIGEKIQEQIKLYRYMLEEGNVYKYLETVGRTMFGKSDSNISRFEAK
jgi:hypothetical protein